MNSDHVNCGGGFGPSWVTSLVNAVGKSKFWNTTAIFVFGTTGEDSTTTFRRRIKISTVWVSAFRCW